MEEPYDGTTRQQLLNLHGDKLLFCTTAVDKSRYTEVKRCFLSKKFKWQPNKPVVILCDKDLNPYDNKCVDWENLHDNLKDANRYVEYIKMLYDANFWRPPFVSKETLELHKREMVEIENYIKKELKDYPNFLGISFCDVNAGGIQINGHHRLIANCAFGKVITIKYDFSNVESVKKDFVEMWKENDTQEYIKQFKSFLENGKKYGWD